TLVRNVAYFFIYFSLMTTACVWMLIPGSCLLQYLSLHNSHFSNVKKLALSYGFSLIMIAWSTPYLLNFYPSAAFDETVREAHRPDPCDSFVALGGVLMPTDEHPKGILNFALECIIPTYVISYGTFAFCICKSRQTLASLNSTLSDKTHVMHRRFLLMLALQNLLPLVVLSVPMTIFFIVVVSGYGMGLMTLIMTFSYWTLPMIQGSVALKFVLLANNPPVERSGMSTTILLSSTTSGVLGSILNCAVLHVLWKRKYPTNLLAYRISITALQWLLMSSIVTALSNKAHLYHSSSGHIVVFGFIAT
ncbi:hypothetical protein PMAYCL1PPCAC_26158, partial [Pristionchus mayeri]